ncbi:MAG: hypothetical protein KF878_38260 [Planctomycetes bacterium]|nr:hypothetical protein [Planctomycetota bacterium]
MADTRLRRLERAASQGDLDARVRLLCERLRAGELDEERARLAAYLGDPAARLLLGARAPELPLIRARGGHELNQRRWITGLRAYGKPWLVRAAVALAEARFTAWDRWDEADERPRRALAAAEDWLRCPCEAHAREADLAQHAALGAAHALVSPGEPRPSTTGREGLSRLLCAAAGAAATAAFAAAQAARAAAADDVLQASACVLNALGGREDTDTIRDALVAAALA